MANLNKVFLMGRLTFDPELRRTPSGTAVTELRMAVNRQYSSREGERNEETLFIDVTVWDRQAENCCQYLKKGRSVHVEGHLKMDTWDDKTTGEKRSKVKVLAERVQFLDTREPMVMTDESSAPPREAPPRRPPAAGNGPAPASNGSAAPTHRPVAESEAMPDDVEDDIPF
jgi:single-strand DNA-binding protein